MVVLKGDIIVRSAPTSVTHFTYRKVPCEEEVRPLGEGTESASPGEARVTLGDRLQAPTTSHEHNHQGCSRIAYVSIGPTRASLV